MMGDAQDSIGTLPECRNKLPGALDPLLQGSANMEGGGIIPNGQRCPRVGVRQGNNLHQAPLGGREHQGHGRGPQKAGGWALEVVGEWSQDLAGIPHKSAVKSIMPRNCCSCWRLAGGGEVVDGLQVLGQRSYAGAGYSVPKNPHE